jgi:hypothetical protein
MRPDMTALKIRPARAQIARAALGGALALGQPKSRARMRFRGI